MQKDDISWYGNPKIVNGNQPFPKLLVTMKKEETLGQMRYWRNPFTLRRQHTDFFCFV